MTREKFNKTPSLLEMREEQTMILWIIMIMLATSPSSAYQINLAKKSQTKTTPHVDLITDLDQNGDGVLNYPEFSANNPRRFLLQDENGDGKLSMDEFVSNSDRVREKNKKKITKDKLQPKMTNHNKEKLRKSHRKMLVSKFSSIDTNACIILYVVHPCPV